MPDFSRLPHRMPQPATDNDFASLATRIVGQASPYLAVDLEPGQEIAFDPHALLWREPSVMLGRTPVAHLVMARGPGRAGFARRLGGMIFPIPLEPGGAVHLAYGQMLLVCGATQADERIQGLGDRLTGSAGFVLTRFTARVETAVVWVQARGEVFERGLHPGEMFDIHPAAFLCKDASVVMENVFPIEQSGTGFDLACLRFTGPGRVAFQTVPEAQATIALADPQAKQAGLRSLLGRR